MRVFVRSWKAWNPAFKVLTGQGLKWTVAGALGVSTFLETALAKEKKQEVYVWGRRESIPGGSEGDVLRPRRIEWFEGHEPGWCKLMLGPSFGAALDNRGKLFVWGQGAGDTFVGPVAVRVGGEAAGFDFVDVQCSAATVYALAKSGHTFVFNDILGALRGHPANEGALSLIGHRVGGLPQPTWRNRLFGDGGVKQMSIGLEHAAFVTKRGEVYAVGGNEWGQSGQQPQRRKGAVGALESFEREEVGPVQVRFPGPIESVTVGGRHTMALGTSGSLYALGDDRRIQLALGDTRSMGGDQRHASGAVPREAAAAEQGPKQLAHYRFHEPHMQWTPTETLPPRARNRPPYPPPTLVACGEDFTVARFRDSPDWYSEDQETNVLFACGENGEGQCGRGYQQQQQVWSMVRLPKKVRTAAIACGQGHTLVLSTSGDLFVWGTNAAGQLGTGSRAPTCPPVRLALDPGGSPKPIKAIFCGFRTSGVICEVERD